MRSLLFTVFLIQIHYAPFSPPSTQHTTIFSENSSIFNPILMDFTVNTPF
jgi:hypothetical protein